MKKVRKGIALLIIMFISINQMSVLGAPTVLLDESEDMSWLDNDRQYYNDEFGNYMYHTLNDGSVEIELIGYCLWAADDSNVDDADTWEVYETYVVPSEIEGKKVTRIAQGGYSGASGIQNIYMSNNITSIGMGAFEQCRSLENIHLSNGIKRIEKYTFRECSSLKSLTIPENVSYINSEAFKDCTSLESLYISSNETEIINIPFFFENENFTIYCLSKDAKAYDYAMKNNLHVEIVDHFTDVGRNKKGFDLTKDGYCVDNSEQGFNYPEHYKIPYERYVETFGKRYTYNRYSQMSEEWGGNCFGMSSTAVMFYNGQLPFESYLNLDTTLNKSGYTGFDECDLPQLNYKSDSSKANLVKLIERYQIAQEEINPWEKYQTDYGEVRAGYFKEICQNIIDHQTPYIVGVDWYECAPNHEKKRMNFYHCGHAMVVDSVRKPEMMQNGWVKLYLYDPNYSYFSDFEQINKVHVTWNNSAKRRCLYLNTLTGEWHMKIFSDDEKQVGENEGNDIALYGGCMIEFCTTEDFPDLTRTGETRFGSNQDTCSITLQDKDKCRVSYRSDTFKVYDANDTLVYEMRDGYNEFINSQIVEDNKYYYENNSQGIYHVSEGQLELPKGKYKICLEEGYIAYVEGDNYAGIVAKNPVTVCNTDADSLAITSEKSGSINVVLEDLASEDNFLSVATDVKTDGDGCEVSLDNQKLELDGITDQLLDVHVVTQDGEKNLQNITPEKLETINLNKSVKKQEKLKDGAKFKNGKEIYKVISEKKKTVSFVKTNADNTKIMVPSKVKKDGVTYKVTKVEDSAFKNNTKVKTVVISGNVTSIGKNAFSGCKKLKKIVIKSGKLTKKGIKNSLKGSNVKEIQLSGSSANKRYKEYSKFFSEKNCGRKVNVKNK